MPFCTQCGSQVGETVAFCGQCGARQGAAKPATKGVLDGVSPRTASILCYVPFLGWIMCIAVLASDRFQDRGIRFHAFQGLYLFVAWLILDWGVGPFLHWFPGRSLRASIDDLLKLTLIAGWIFMMVKTSQNENYRLPLFGELAERSLAEQR